MSATYWMLLNEKGAPLLNSPCHPGWSKLEYVQLGSDFTTSGHGAGLARASKAGRFTVGIRPDPGFQGLLATFLGSRTLAAVAIDAQVPQGKWSRFEFGEVSVEYLTMTRGVAQVDLVFKTLRYTSI